MEEMRVVLKGAGVIARTSASEYAGIGGYEGLKKALEAPRKIVDIMKSSGLRGRGGAGFPAGLKMSFTSGLSAPQKFIVANADEGEPGTCKDRIIMSEVPHRLFEGMAIAGLGVGADKGFIYLRAEYPKVAETLTRALDDARDKGYIGKNIMGSGRNFDIELRHGAGAYVCGEETALLDSMEGKRGEPRFKPPFPGVSGLWGKPTVVNNVETLANFPAIMVKGPEWYRSMGTAQCPGTKLFTLSGSIKNPGIYEFPVGTTIRSLFEEVGGGCPNGKRLLAVQTGGASGCIIPPSLLDTPMDPENCAETGATFGTGALIFMDEDCCLLDVLKNLMEFFEHESCGKCTPCREGTSRILELISKFAEGTGTKTDLEIIKELGSFMMEGSLCGMGQASPSPVLSAIGFFPEIFQTKTGVLKEVN